VRRWTYIVGALLVAILAFNVASDRLAPLTFQTTAETLVVPVTPQVNGMLLDVPVRDNSRVAAGQLLAVVDPTSYRLAVENARASYGAAQQAIGAAAAGDDSARAVVTSARVQLVQAQQDNDRTATLVKAGYATRAKLEVTKATLASRQAGVVQAEAQLAEARKASRQSAIQTILGIMADNDLSGADLGFVKPARAPRKPRQSSTAPKYRDIASGQTWAGRGRQPTWLVTALAQGRTLQSFEVAAAS
jgi:multidrug resistance efflux pump